MKKYTNYYLLLIPLIVYVLGKRFIRTCDISENTVALDSVFRLANGIETFNPKDFKFDYSDVRYLELKRRKPKINSLYFVRYYSCKLKKIKQKDLYFKGKYVANGYLFSNDTVLSISYKDRFDSAFLTIQGSYRFHKRLKVKETYMFLKKHGLVNTKDKRFYGVPIDSLLNDEVAP